MYSRHGTHRPFTSPRDVLCVKTCRISSLLRLEIEIDFFFFHPWLKETEHTSAIIQNASLIPRSVRDNPRIPILLEPPRGVKKESKKQGSVLIINLRFRVVQWHSTVCCVILAFKGFMQTESSSQKACLTSSRQAKHELRRVLSSLMKTRVFNWSPPSPTTKNFFCAVATNNIAWIHEQILQHPTSEVSNRVPLSIQLEVFNTFFPSTELSEVASDIFNWIHVQHVWGTIIRRDSIFWLSSPSMRTGPLSVDWVDRSLKWTRES